MSNNEEVSMDMGFDTSEVAPAQALQVIPDTNGVLMTITNVGIKDTKDEDGKVIKKRMSLTLTVSDPESKYKGRKVFQAYNIRNPNLDHQREQQAQVSLLARACGVDGRDASKLIGCEVLGDVRHDPAKGDYEAKNKIKDGSWKPANGQSMATTGDAAPATTKPAVDTRPAFMRKPKKAEAPVEANEQPATDEAKPSE